MNPIISKKETIYGTRVHCNFLKKNFLTQHVDLGFEFDDDTLGKPINDLIDLPLGSVAAPVLEYDQNTKTPILNWCRNHTQITKNRFF